MKAVGTRHPLVVLTTASFPERHLDLLKTLGIECRVVGLLEPKGEVKLIAERFRDTWSKLQAFALEDYEVSEGTAMHRSQALTCLLPSPNSASSSSIAI